MTAPLIARLTVQQIDLRLTAMRQAFRDALTRADLRSADAAYAEIDDLLEQRFEATR